MDRKESVFEEIQEEHLDNMIKLALKQAEAEGLLDNNGFEDEPITEEEAQKTYELFLQKWRDLREQKIKEERKQKTRNIFKLGTRAIVCALLCLALAAPIAIACIEPIRDYVTNILISIKDDHVTLELLEENNSLVPEGWIGKYYPTYIPERYHLARLNQFSAKAIYIDQENYIFYYSESDKDERVDIDNENAVTWFETIGIYDVFVLEKKGFVTFVWSNNNLLFIISGYMSLDEAKDILNSIVKVSP
ncbi:MAG: DUF4367 domain-containing protein [Clostridiales bacterium]|nr:DUF4367 domain-containing protein [Clostridiales bacterium]